MDSAALERELTALGVRPGYVRRIVSWLQDARSTYASSAAMQQLQQAHPLLASILALPDKEAAVEYLVLYTPEQDLPPKLRPTAASESFVTSAASGGGSESLVDRWTVDKFTRCAGFPRENVERAIRDVRAAGLHASQTEKEGAVLDLLLHALMGEPVPVHAPPAYDEAVAQKRSDERMMLAACLGDEALRPVPERDAIDKSDFDVDLGTYGGDQVYLRVSMHPASSYLVQGTAWPSVYVTSPSLPTFLRLALTRHALRCLSLIHI